MSSEDLTEESEYEPRPNDFLVEPMFAPFEKEAESEPEARTLLGRLMAWLRGR